MGLRAGCGRRINPTAKYADDLFQTARVARTLKAAAFESAGDPVTGRAVKGQLLWRSILSRGAGQVDDQLPAALFVRAQMHALAVLPLAIALLPIPGVEPLQMVCVLDWHGHQLLRLLLRHTVQRAQPPYEIP